MYHTPVLLAETIDLLSIAPESQVIDATVGDGGHTTSILSLLGSQGRILGLDASPRSLARARARIGSDPRVTLVHANFSTLAQIADAQGMAQANAILFDLGIASWQLDPPSSEELREGGRTEDQRLLGLSFQRDEPLDMRLDPRLDRTAADIVNRSTPDELMTIFEEYGGLHRSRSLVDRLITVRRQQPITTTTQLVTVIGTGQPRLLAPLFQALRIAVNDELSLLPSALDQAIDRLAGGGRLAVISFHSGEDRIVKQQFQASQQVGRVQVITRRPIAPSLVEQRANPRSRSAKLRVVEKKLV